MVPGSVFQWQLCNWVDEAFNPSFKQYLLRARQCARGRERLKNLLSLEASRLVRETNCQQIVIQLKLRKVRGESTEEPGLGGVRDKGGFP